MAQANFTVTEKDMVSMMRLACLRRFKLRAGVYVVLALLAMKFGGSYTPWLLVAALLIFLPSVVMLLLIPSAVRQSYIDDPSLSEERHFSFGSDGMRYQTGEGPSQDKKWSSIKRWHENGRYISLALKNGGEFVVPVDQVSTSFVNGLKERLTLSGLPKPRRSRLTVNA